MEGREGASTTGTHVSAGLHDWRRPAINSFHFRILTLLTWELCFHACPYLWECVCVCLHALASQHFCSAAITNLMPRCMRRTSNSPCMHHRVSIWPSEQTQQQPGPVLLCTLRARVWGGSESCRSWYVQYITVNMSGMVMTEPVIHY